MIWILDDLNETLDIQEDEAEITQVRNHVVIQIHALILASDLPNTLQIGDTKSAITYRIGNMTRTNNPKGSGKFICVGDGAAPHEHPSEFVTRRQVWEYFGEWEAAPAEWNQ